MATTTAVNNTPTIPIKQVTQKKFIPLVVSSITGDIKIQAKLYDVSASKNLIETFLNQTVIISLLNQEQKIQAFIQEILNQ